MSNATLARGNCEAVVVMAIVSCAAPGAGSRHDAQTAFVAAWHGFQTHAKRAMETKTIGPFERACNWR